jgi:hypothetical protein
LLDYLCVHVNLLILQFMEWINKQYRVSMNT